MSIKINNEVKRLVSNYCPVNLTIINQGDSGDAVYFDVIEEDDNMIYAETGLNQLSQFVITHLPLLTVKYSPYEINDNGQQVWMIEFSNLILDNEIFDLANFYCPVGVNMTCSSLQLNGVSCEFMDIFNNTSRALMGAYQLIEIITEKYPFLSHHIKLYDKEENEEQMFCIDFLYQE